ncbi:ABC transporter substrate-binding protein [Corynebacterium lizhenjunii]|uniref:ABC transporter substrate-binding protein n=1 Tax=Corynebacterium lizhenjunii TaxID=2709394 RepID=A0A7T0KGX0_9CORY|nr:ABC transporter substrate-binding protein [Corynebacterium lizhenjunii]QPK79744.1 ABC transporter substrate-binding protein [Corynebacterium lizhenjunii]
MILRRTAGRKVAGSVAALAAASLVLTSCSQAEDAATSATDAASSAVATTTAEVVALTVEDNYGTHTLNAPFERVAVTDNRSFEILSQWGVNIVAAPVPLVPKTLRDKINEDTVEANLGTHKEPDLEALVAADPDIVINGQRFERYQEDMQTLVGKDIPVLDFEPRDGEDLPSELIRQTLALGTIFNHEDDAQALVDDFNKALERAKAAYDPSKTIMAVNTSGGEIGYIAPGKGRFFGPFFDMLGWKPSLEVAGGTNNHEGDDISVEAIAQSNPDWIFIMDRDGAIGAKDGVLHGEALIKDNAALQNVTAVKQGNVVAAPEDTYTNENIITYTEVLNAIADAFESAK